MRNAWTHAEALQTTDISGLMNYIGDVLDSVREFPAQMDTIFQLYDIHQRQEVLVFYYLCTLMNNLDRISEGTMMGILRSRKVFMNGARLLASYHPHLSRAYILKIAEALSLIAGSEDFSTYFDEHICGRDDAELLQDLKSGCLSLFSADFESRRLLRSLYDAIDKAQRKYRRK